MNRNIKKALVVKTIFVESFKKQITQEDTLALSAVVGLGQGLKYNGSIKRGINAGISAAITYGCINRVHNVIEHWGKLDKLVDELEKED